MYKLQLVYPLQVHGKRFVYKFVCDLKMLLGYSAAELSTQVTMCANRKIQKVRQLVHPLGKQKLVTQTVQTTLDWCDCLICRRYSGNQYKRLLWDKGFSTDEVCYSITVVILTIPVPIQMVVMVTFCKHMQRKGYLCRFINSHLSAVLSFQYMYNLGLPYWVLPSFFCP